MSAPAMDPGKAAVSALSQIALGLAGERGGDLSYGALKRGLRETAKRDPLDTLLVMVFGGSYLFYLAEKDANPKCTSIWDALVFVTTSLSVGYDDVFARTPSGKAIASFLMTFGPSIANSVFNPPASEPVEPTVTVSPEALDLQRSILARLDAILEALRPAASAASAEGSAAETKTAAEAPPAPADQAPSI